MKDDRVEREKGIRRCIGCGQSFPKEGLLRIVRSPSGMVSIDESGIAPGRGAYICSRGCFEQARKRFGRALRITVSDSTLSDIAVGVERWEKKMNRE